MEEKTIPQPKIDSLFKQPYKDKPAHLRKVYNMDFDGTITLNNRNYVHPTPNFHIIQKIRELYQHGAIIHIWTARPWDNAHEVAAFCITHKVPFHGIMMQKGGTDVYVDDKAMTIADFLKEPI